MTVLRLVIVLYAIFCLVGGIIIFINHKSNLNLLIAIYLLINFIVIIVGIIFEKSRYKPSVTSKSGWITTQERFIDPKSGKTVEVKYNPKTGERDYIKVSTKSK